MAPVDATLRVARQVLYSVQFRTVVELTYVWLIQFTPTTPTRLNSLQLLS